MAVPCANASWSAPADNAGSQQITNAVVIAFPQSTGAQGNATYFAIWDAAAAGNLLHHGALAVARNVDSAGITISIPVGDLAIREG